MSALTRILNNQIYNGTIIASQKIAAGTITGSLFASNVTVPGDLLISGNLFVLGTSAYTTIASTNTYVNDPLITLNNGFSGTNTYDEGLIFNRGTLQNRAFLWSEYNSEFRLIGTTEAGTTYGNVTVSNYANLHIGNLTVDYNVSLATLTAESVNTSGNVLASTVLASLVTADDATFGNVAAGFIGNVGTVFTGASVNVSGNVSAATLIAGQINTTGNLLAATVGASYLTASTATIGNISAVTIGNAGAYLTGEILNITGNVSGGLARFAAINDTPIGNATPSSAAFTTLTSSGVTTVTNTTDATGLGTGAFRVSGGTSITGNLWVGGNLNIVGNAFTIISNAGVFYGDLAGFGALYAGVAGYTPLPSTVFQSSADFNGYAQNNFENLSIGNQASTDWVATAGDGTDIDHYIDMGIVTANWDGTQDNSLTNALGANDGYLYVQGNVATGQGGNLVVGASAPGAKKVSVIVGGNTAASISAVFRNPNTPATTTTTGALTVTGGVGITGNAVIGANLLAQGAAILQSTLTTVGTVSFTDSTNSTSTTQGGALTVSGGAAIAKDLWVGGNVYAANIIGTSYQYLTIVDPLVNFRANSTYPYNYDIGFYSSFVGGAANLEATSGVIRDNADGVWKFFSNTAEPTGGAISFDGDTLWDGIKAGNLFLTNATDASSNSTGALIVTGGAGVGATLYARDIQSTVIGNVTPAAGFFTQLNATGNVVATDYRGSSLNVTGNVSASGGIFATVGVTGGIWANSTTDSTSTSTGSIVSAGGLGLAGNIFQGGAYHDTSASNALLFNTPSTVDAFKNAISLTMGSSSSPSTTTLNSDIILGSQATQFLYNTLTDTINFGGAANITMGHTDGTTTLQGNANVRATTKSVTYTRGAVVSAGGVGVAGNVSIAGGSRLTIGTELLGEVFPENQIQIVGNTNSPIRSFIYNQSLGTSATAEYVAAVQNSGTQLLTGVVGSNYNQSTGIKPDTGYTLVTGGDLIVGASANVGILVGNISTSNTIVSFNSLYYNVAVTSSTVTTSPTTGAFTVAGGVGIGANLNVGNGATINYNQSSEDFVVQGKVTTSLIRAVSDYGAVVIGGSNATPTLGAVAKFNSTDSVHLPVGTSSQRPGSSGNTDVTGMIRFNTTINNLEFYDGTLWQTPGGTFTVITSRQFAGNTAGSYGNVDGTNTNFTLQSSSTTASTIVSINGVLQIPVLAYSVSGDVLTFTEPPAPGDIIDSRVLSTTVTVSTLASGDGYDQFIAEDGVGASIWTGTSATTRRVLVDKVGNMNLLTGNKLTYTQTAVNAPATGATLIDTWSQSTYTTAKYVIQSKVGSTNVESYESMIMTDGSGNAYVSTYGIINNGVTIGTITANVSAGNVNVYYNTTIAQANVKAFGTFIV